MRITTFFERRRELLRKSVTFFFLKHGRQYRSHSDGTRRPVCRGEKRLSQRRTGGGRPARGPRRGAGEILELLADLTPQITEVSKKSCVHCVDKIEKMMANVAKFYRARSRLYLLQRRRRVACIEVIKQIASAPTNKHFGDNIAVINQLLEDVSEEVIPRGSIDVALRTSASFTT